MNNETIDNQDELNNHDKPGVGWQILAFLIPISGIIMYFNNRGEFPIKAQRYIQLAGFGFAFGIIVRILRTAFLS